ncbi:MAG: 2-oxoacid:ferredoxin oxidoreductase subunit beta [Flavobacteriales bacterium]|nr:2-oxoacid:ferredoxin oxidoreductase subunit beta [Flavobacteriia bacterium]NCP05850.1 2-oxoacid:ferredoxin oxidoreductase subunit beta [Flavobacteriales bacterium]PIV93201.1 MAG: 2-oxoacid:ferredoxin oxidoreductase subunit beta [Flavobacteriaceae bacterium CG17_big_fil_post_rev_8_21_14_2_50_33_15]PIY12492.1 MAG: 2-oxoacid:ferredoxin oxidoreductase subunit beta [Flavobacteriaceae bacterium CG_4_10_14_3_um_filter_33_47]PJB19752.1 MAG: 2-oxoacid:ferredoxin oxidoreductase subunit beta [Flavobact
MEAIVEKKYTYKDFESDQEVRWCPGCDDYVILRSMQKALPEMGVKKEEVVFVSGIGCSSRFPYYMDTYGMHSIHGRAPAIASGIKLANPKLSVWVMTGDGDAMAIGGNHFIHVLRRNIDLNIVLFNNEIYGLTKGQFSPTSLVGQKTKSSPYGNTQPPFSPGELALGANARFFGRIGGNVPKDISQMLIEAHKFKGTSLIEVLQNCVIFNDGCYNHITNKDVKEDKQIYLEHGKPMIFGKNRDKGLRLNKLKLEVVTIGENGITEDDLLVHNAKEKDPTMHQMLVRLEYPVATGIIRSFDDVTLEEREDALTKQVKANSKFSKTNDLFFSGEIYMVK